jgi:hypothetical protein
MKYLILDRTPRWQTLQNDIRLLSAEILRISNLPYSSKRSREKVISLDKQIQYLEQVLASYEKDQKEKFD